MPLPPDFAWFPDAYCPDKLCLRIGGLYGCEVVIVRERNGWSQDTSTGSPQACKATSQ